MTEPSEHRREIAVIGLACRFPGAQNPDQFWANLRDGVESISRFTDEELLASGIAPEVLRLPNYVKAGGVLPGIELFDAGFFGMSRREAEMTDPQQRVFLEVAWEGLESAGYDPQRYNGSIGIFAGSSISTYLLFNLVPDVSIIGSGEHFPTLIGNDKDYLATHVSYKLNLHGPSMSIQTACSTSLVAIHTACQSLLNGECDMAIAGGVAISVPQQTGYFYQEGAYFSPDGSCRSFSAGARGTVFGSGAGVVVLKRLADALRDGDCIDAIVKGSAINNDGATKVGFTAPSVEGQARAISEALAIAEVSLESIGYVEAHGTATPLGDPIEIAALSLAFSSQKLPAASCAIGSVKSNVGHLDSAAGVCGFIKTALALKHAQVPPSLHCSTPNPNIDFGRTPFYVNTGLRPWPVRGDQPRRAGVSSFGIGGTNAHVVLEEPSRAPAVAPGGRSHSMYALPLSARSAEALRELAHAYRTWISAHTSSDDLRDLCYSASVRRAHHRPHRLCLVANSAQQLVQQLDAFLSYEAAGGLFADSSRGRAGSAPRVGFVFSGQGAQWWGMGRELLTSSATFRDAIAEIDALFQRRTNDWRLWEELTASEEKSRLDCRQIEITQCTLFALQVALARMWRAFGVEPVAVIGHSMGEVAAAVVSGALSLEDGVRVIYERGHLLQRAVGHGAMAALELSEAEVLAFLADGHEGVGIAAVNGARATVVSGESGAVARLIHDLTERGLMVRELRTSGVAGHSEQVAGVSADLERALSGMRARTSDLSLISTVAGRRVAGEQLDAAYWKRNLRQPVRFKDGMAAILNEGVEVFVEINAHPILGLWVKEALGRVEGSVVATLRREQSAWDVTVEGLAEIYVAGADLNWQEVWTGTRANYVRLPAYPWQRERYWIEPRRRVDQRLSRVADASEHPLFVKRVQSSVQPDTHFWEVDLQSESLAYLKGHRIQETVVVPASLYIEIVFAAARELFGDAVVVLNDVTFPRVLLIHPRRARKLQLVISRAEGKFSISSLAEESPRSDWTLHASGKIGCGEVTSRIICQPQEIVDRCHEVVSSADHYAELEKAGLHYGSAFRGVREVFVGGDTCIGRLRLSEDVARADGQVVHPGLLDSAFQVLTRLRNGAGSGSDIYLPVGISELRLTTSLQADADYWGHGTLLSTDETEVETSLSILTEDGSPVLELYGVRARRLALDDYVASSQEFTEWFHEIEWIKSPRHDSHDGDPDVVERWLVFSDRSGLGDELSSLITRHGHDCVQVFAGSEYRNETGKRFAVDPLNPKHFQRLFEDVVSDSDNPRLGIVHLWSLDVAHSSNLSPKTLDEGRKLACGSLLHLVQALAHHEPPRLWLITRGSQAIGPKDEVSGVAQSMLWGLGKVVAIEHSELNCVRIDLDPAKPAVETAALWNELNSKTDEEEIALRDGSRFASRLRHLPLEHDTGSQPSNSIRSDALYLITGGLGGLGLSVAKWLVDQGARHLVLISRTGASETTKAAVESLRNAGAEITIFKTDVSVAEELTAALNTIEQMDAPLAGVIHAAGVLDDGFLLRLDWERFERVTKAKVEGAWNLHHQLRDKHLDFFVLFSSAGSMLGVAGQANHVAGNSFLDALAHHRRACSLPALSINWSQWGDTGRVANSVESERLQLQGIPRMSNTQGLRALELLLGQDTAQVGVMKFDLEQWSSFYPRALNSSLLRNFARELPGQKAERPDIRSTLRAAQTHRQQLALLEEFVRGEVAWVLRLSPKDIPSDAFFSDLALDSLRSLELRNRLEHGLNLTLPATLVWQFPTIDNLTPHLAEKLNLVSDETKPLLDQTIADRQSRISEIERLSDAEAEVWLRSRLESLQLSSPGIFDR